MKTKIKGVLALLLIAGMTQAAMAYIHPCIPLTSSDLTELNKNKNTAPWSTGLSSFNNSGEKHTKLTYKMEGPFADVGRTPDLNRNAFKDDMSAIEGLAIQWKLTGNSAYADLAKKILLAWATTHKSWSGAESYLDSGDYASRVFLGASILRSYSGWSAANTTTVKNYFNNVWWGQSPVPNPLNSANQGADQLNVSFGVAAYCDDTTKMNQAITAWQQDACGGISDSLSNGEIGDTGRDQGHAYGELWSLSWCAEVAWKAARIDLFGQLNNRLKAAGEYYAQYNNGGNPAWINFGTCYGRFTSIGGGRTSVNPNALDILQGAYVIRKGQSMPQLTAYRNNQSYAGWERWFYRKNADSSTATASGISNPTEPGTSALTSLTGVQVDTTGNKGSSSYNNGVWTIKGDGRDIYGPSTDGFWFAYKKITGNNCEITAHIAKSSCANNSGQAGIMMRQSLANNSTFISACLHPPGNGFMGNQRGMIADHRGETQSYSNLNLPCWLKIWRNGDRFTAYTSPDGKSWAPVIHAVWSGAPGTIYVGLCAEGKNSGLNTATFDNVKSN